MKYRPLISQHPTRSLGLGSCTALDLVQSFSMASSGESQNRRPDPRFSREIANDPKQSSADRGWIKQELNEIKRGKRRNIRRPPGKQLSHERGREAAKGFNHSNSKLQDAKLHKLQHKYDNFGKKNKLRPIE